MRGNISIDLEGVAGVATMAQVARGDHGYPRAQQLIANGVSAAIAGVFEGGATEVLINDSPGTMDNLMHAERTANRMVKSVARSPSEAISFVQCATSSPLLRCAACCPSSTADTQRVRENAPDDSDQAVGVRVVQAILVGAHEHRDRVTPAVCELDHTYLVSHDADRSGLTADLDVVAREDAAQSVRPDLQTEDPPRLSTRLWCSGFVRPEQSQQPIRIVSAKLSVVDCGSVL
jgi:hypothetical protein